MRPDFDGTIYLLMRQLDFKKKIKENVFSCFLARQERAFLLPDPVSTNGKVVIVTLLLKLESCKNYGY